MLLSHVIEITGLRYVGQTSRGHISTENQI